MTRPAGRHLGRYLTALARAADWTGPDPGLPARPRLRSQFEPEPGDDGPSWLLGVDDRESSGAPDTRAVTDPGGGSVDEAGRDGPGTDRTPTWPPPPTAVTVATPAPPARPLDVPPVRIGAADAVAVDRPWIPDPAPPGRPAVLSASAPAPPSRAADPGSDAAGARTAAPSPAASARPVPVPDAADPDAAEDRRRPGESGDGHRRADHDSRGDAPGDEPPSRPRATARPAVSTVVDDPLVRPTETTESASPPPPPVIIEIGRIEVRIAADGPAGPSAPSAATAPSRPALPAPGPTLADYLDGLAGTAGRRP